MHDRNRTPWMMREPVCRGLGLDNPRATYPSPSPSSTQAVQRPFAKLLSDMSQARNPQSQTVGATALTLQDHARLDQSYIHKGVHSAPLKGRSTEQMNYMLTSSAPVVRPRSKSVSTSAASRAVMRGSPGNGSSALVTVGELCVGTLSIECTRDHQRHPEAISSGDDICLYLAL
eukprot:Skav225833  [mRNA]  locus=scaffold345:21883:23388:+ [translate_table: standard]